MKRKGRQKAGEMAEKGGKRGIILSLLMVSSVAMMPGFKMFLFLCLVSFVHQGKKKAVAIFCGERDKMYSIRVQYTRLNYSFPQVENH